MQDQYVGDIGDYGKYGLLRTVSAEGVSLSVNWYKVAPRRAGKQYDGKYVEYLLQPHLYREYDTPLFDSLRHIVHEEKDRRIERIEKECLFPARFFSEVIGSDRKSFHQRALLQTSDTDAVFLDPDNGLESARMYARGCATEKHVKWSELKAYYERGQSVILYQHRPQMMKKETCIDNVLHFQRTFLHAEHVMLLEFPKYTNRFYFIFAHEKHFTPLQRACSRMARKWGKNGVCRQISIGEVMPLC